MKFNIANDINKFSNLEALYGQFKSEVFALFIKVFETTLGQGQVPQFDILIKKVLASFNLEEYLSIFSPDCSNWFSKITTMTYLDCWITDNRVREIILHSHCFLQIEIEGNFHNVNTILISEKEYLLSINYLALVNGQEINFSTPFVSFYTELKNTPFRATIIHQSTSPLNRAKVFLRKIQKQIFKLANFTNEIQSLFIDDLIKQKANIIISGATGSGKTAMLSALVESTSEKEHLIILEDTYEILVNRANITSMLADNTRVNSSLKDYCSYALRMRPDRIIIGELRSYEVIPFILAMNTGHNGLLSSIHANSALDTIFRLATLFCFYGESKEMSYELVLKLICKNLNYVIHMEQKKISQIIKIVGIEKMVPYFETIYTKSGGTKSLA